VAPAKYELTLPAGGRLTAGDLTRLETLARTNNLSNDDAQAFVLEQDAVLKAQADAWHAETMADKDLGGDKLAESQRLTQIVIDRIFPKGDPTREPFLEFMARGGAGNNINVVRALARIGKLMAEDGSVTGGISGVAGEKTLAQKMYPNQNP
jgi:hypothetical protein